MSNRRAILVASASVVVIAIVAAVFIGFGSTRSSPRRPTGSNSLSLGFTAVHRTPPSFSLPSLRTGRRISLKNLPDMPVVLNFWSSTCTVCRKESPAIEKVARATSKKVDYIGIDTVDVRSAALAFIRKYGISYPIAMDATGTIAGRYGVPGLPMTFFLSPAKKIVGVNVGALTVGKLERILSKLYGISVSS